MAFGSLASYPTTDNFAHILYTSPSSNFVEGKVYAVNMSSVPVKIRVAVLGTANINDLAISDYIIYNHLIPTGDRFISDGIFLKNGESVVVRADSPGVKFSFRGSEVGLTTTVCGIISAFSPSTSLKIGAGQTVFNLPVSMVETDANLYITNTSPDYVEVSVGIGTTIGSNHYLVYNQRVEPGHFFCQDDIKLGAGEIIFAKSTSTNVNIVALGKTTHR
jgi:hypothetical protein